VTGAQINPYKVYLANFYQSGTNAPTINYSYSELTGTLTFTRVRVGEYLITNSVAEFTLNKTFVFHNAGAGTIIKYYQYQIDSTTQIYIYTYNSAGITADGLISDNSLEIKIIK
jgi:hypothetical protein